MFQGPKTMKLLSVRVMFPQPKIFLSKLFVVLSNSVSQPVKASRWGSLSSIISQVWWEISKRWSCLDERNSLEKRKRKIAHKRYWDYKEAYISLLLQTSFLLIITPTLYFPPSDATGENITLYKQMSTHSDCLTMLCGPWSIFFLLPHNYWACCRHRNVTFFFPFYIH